MILIRHRKIKKHKMEKRMRKNRYAIILKHTRKVAADEKVFRERMSTLLAQAWQYNPAAYVSVCAACPASLS